VLAAALLRRPAEVAAAGDAAARGELLARLQARGAALTFCRSRPLERRRAAATCARTSV
jgi:hypothetical protein